MNVDSRAVENARGGGFGATAAEPKFYSRAVEKARERGIQCSWQQD